MEDKKMLNDEELNEVSGGITPGTDFYVVGANAGGVPVYCECKECGTTVRAVKLDEGYRYKYICLTNKSHIWYEEK